MEHTINKDPLTRAAVEIFVGEKSSYYLDKWDEHQNSKFKGWNWAAGVFAAEWMAYRKMYVEALLYLIFIVAISFALNMLFRLWGISIAGELIAQIFRILAGLLGNILYQNKVLRVLRKTSNISDSDRIRVMRKKGGVSIVAIIVMHLIGFWGVFMIPSIIMMSS